MIHAQEDLSFLGAFFVGILVGMVILYALGGVPWLPV